MTALRLRLATGTDKRPDSDRDPQEDEEKMGTHEGARKMIIRKVRQESKYMRESMERVAGPHGHYRVTWRVTPRI